MERIAPIDPAAATGRTKELLEDVERTFGSVPNLFRTAAASPATLESMLRQFQILGAGLIDKDFGEQLALAVAQVNGCPYCLSAHTAIGRLFGVPEAELEASRRALSNNPKKQAALEFAQEVTRNRGAVSEADFARLRTAGWSEAEIAEILAHVALNTFTNLYAIATQMEIDWPLVPVDEARAA